MRQSLIILAAFLFALPAFGQSPASTDHESPADSHLESSLATHDPGARSSLQPGFPPPTASEAHAAAVSAETKPPQNLRHLDHKRCSRRCFIRPSVFSPARKYREPVPTGDTRSRQSPPISIK